MANLPTNEENTALLRLLLACGQRAKAAASQSFEVFKKGHEDYVTTVDRALDQYLAEGITGLFPEAGIITEENPASAAEFFAEHAQLWFIDPIDGTEEFIHRGPHYSVMVGLMSDHLPQAGWIQAPADGRTCWGGPDWGLFQQYPGTEVLPLTPTVPDRHQTAKILLGDRDQRRFGTALSQILPTLEFYSIGSFGLKVLEVITGKAGLYVYLNGRVKLWDTVGPLALGLAAGLICCDLDGHPIQFDTNNIYPLTLIHRQPMIIGWPAYINAYLPGIRQAVLAVRGPELSLPSGKR